MLKPVLQEVKIKDIKVLRALSIQTFSEKFSDNNEQDNLNNYLKKSFSEEQLSAELNNTNSFFYFLKLEDVIVGYLKLNKGDAQNELLDTNSIELERIYILKNYQRKRLGHFLMNFAIEWAENQKAIFIWLGVWEKNEAAIKFYKRYDFVVFSTHDFVVGNDRQTDFLMKRLLRN